jgi:O-antigen ligase
MQISFFKISKFLLLFPMIGVVFVTTSTLFPFIVGKYVWFRSAVLIALISFLLGLLFDTKNDLMWKRFLSFFHSPLVIGITIFVSIFLISGFFGVDPVNSFWSNFERGEGGLQILCFYIYLLLLISLYEEEKDWHRLLWWGVGGGVLMSLYGFFAGLGANGFIGQKFNNPDFRFQGSIGNPAYVATYAIFLMFYVAYLFIKKYNKNIRSAGGILMLILFILFFIIFLAAATRGGFVGLIVSVIGCFAYIGFASKKWRKKFLIATAALILIFSGMIVMSNTEFAKDLPGSRLFDLSVRAQTFEHRMIMWKIAWDGFKERPLLGWGPENFLQIFDTNFNTKYYNPAQGFGAWFDRAHSIYFDYLAEIGILGFLSYFSIFIIFYILLFKKSGLFSKDGKVEIGKKEKYVEKIPVLEGAILFSLPLSYLVQGIVLFDVSIIYVNLFVFFALATYRLSNKEQVIRNK